jgi:hypothetical protein
MKCHYHKEINFMNECKVCHKNLCSECIDPKTNCCWICSIKVKNEIHYETESEERKIRATRSPINLRIFITVYLTVVILIFIPIIVQFIDLKFLSNDIKVAMNKYLSNSCNMNIHTRSINLDYFEKYTFMSEGHQSWVAILDNGEKISGHFGKEDISFNTYTDNVPIQCLKGNNSRDGNTFIFNPNKKVFLINPFGAVNAYDKGGISGRESFFYLLASALLIIIGLISWVYFKRKVI